MRGKLFVVATPIGNFEDITLRALRILREVDFVFCEDTREGHKLLSHFGIKKSLDSYHAKSSFDKAEKIVNLLNSGKNIALISDAGTPGISDPGLALVERIRRSSAEVGIFAIPGPSALSAAVSVAGLPASEFVFLGFLPNKKGRDKIFREMTESKRISIFYESPHRIIKTLLAISEKAGSSAKIAVCRELTKIHEEVFSGTPSDVLAYYKNSPDKIRGEFVVIFQPV